MAKKLPVILRQCGFSPAFSDAEVLTLEVVAEFMGYEQDKQAWEYFHRHWLEWFPKLPSRSTDVRQAAHCIRARDRWHLTVRIFRKVLSHTVAVFLKRMIGNSSLQLVNLLV